MEYIFFLVIFFVFYLGSIFGSFLNVVVVELENTVFSEDQLSVRLKRFWKRINRRSVCPSCKRCLTSTDLFPLFSFLLLRAKCQGCQGEIPARYFWVEIFSGAIFLGLFWKVFYQGLVVSIDTFPQFFYMSLWWEFGAFLPVMFGIILIFLFDWKHKIIPDIVLLPMFFYTLVLITFDFSREAFSLTYFTEDLVRACSFALPFLAISVISRGRAMGFADWKLVLVLSLFLENVMQNLLFVFGAFWIGALMALPSLIFSKKTLKTEVPFGPYIVASFLLVFFLDLSYYSFLDLISF